jgi:hypothetical protein
MLSTLTYSKLIIWRFLLLNSKSTFQESLNSHDSRNCRPMDDQKITMIGIRWACLCSDGNSSLLKSRCSRFSQILTFVRRKLLEKVGDVRSRLVQFFFDGTSLFFGRLRNVFNWGQIRSPSLPGRSKFS